MARRSHRSEVGLVAFDDLAELGAGIKEGWLTDGSVLASLYHRSLALAGPSLAAVLRLDAPSPPILIRPSLSSAEGVVTAVEWIVAGDLAALALGTSAGYLLLYSLESELIHRQIVHPGQILKLRFREMEELSYDAPLLELCVVMQGVIARFDGSDLKNLLEKWFLDANRRNMEEGEGNSDKCLPYRLWNVSKYGSCADAAITGIMPPPLMELEGSNPSVAQGSSTLIESHLSGRVVVCRLSPCTRVLPYQILSTTAEATTCGEEATSTEPSRPPSSSCFHLLRRVSPHVQYPHRNHALSTIELSAVRCPFSHHYESCSYTHSQPHCVAVNLLLMQLSLNHPLHRRCPSLWVLGGFPLQVAMDEGAEASRA